MPATRSGSSAAAAATAAAASAPTPAVAAAVAAAVASSGSGSGNGQGGKQLLLLKQALASGRPMGRINYSKNKKGFTGFNAGVKLGAAGVSTKEILIVMRDQIVDVLAQHHQDGATRHLLKEHLAPVCAQIGIKYETNTGIRMLIRIVVGITDKLQDAATAKLPRVPRGKGQQPVASKAAPLAVAVAAEPAGGAAPPEASRRAATKKKWPAHLKSRRIPFVRQLDQQQRMQLVLMVNKLLEAGHTRTSPEWRAAENKLHTRFNGIPRQGTEWARHYLKKFQLPDGSGAHDSTSDSMTSTTEDDAPPALADGKGFTLDETEAEAEARRIGRWPAAHGVKSALAALASVKENKGSHGLAYMRGPPACATFADRAAMQGCCTTPPVRSDFKTKAHYDAFTKTGRMVQIMNVVDIKAGTSEIAAVVTSLDTAKRLQDFELRASLRAVGFEMRLGNIESYGLRKLWQAFTAQWLEHLGSQHVEPQAMRLLCAYCEKYEPTVKHRGVVHDLTALCDVCMAKVVMVVPAHMRERKVELAPFIKQAARVQQKKRAARARREEHAREEKRRSHAHNTKWLRGERIIFQIKSEDTGDVLQVAPRRRDAHGRAIPLTVERVAQAFDEARAQQTGESTAHNKPRLYDDTLVGGLGEVTDAGLGNMRTVFTLSTRLLRLSSGEAALGGLLSQLSDEMSQLSVTTSESGEHEAEHLRRAMTTLRRTSAFGETKAARERSAARARAAEDEPQAGAHVLKIFNTGTYEGTLTKVWTDDDGHRHYHIKYRDGDREDMDRGEFVACHGAWLSAQTPQRASKRRRVEPQPATGAFFYDSAATAGGAGALGGSPCGAATRRSGEQRMATPVHGNGKRTAGTHGTPCAPRKLPVTAGAAVRIKQEPPRQGRPMPTAVAAAAQDGAAESPIDVTSETGADPRRLAEQARCTRLWPDHVAVADRQATKDTTEVNVYQLLPDGLTHGETDAVRQMLSTLQYYDTLFKLGSVPAAAQGVAAGFRPDGSKKSQADVMSLCALYRQRLHDMYIANEYPVLAAAMRESQRKFNEWYAADATLRKQSGGAKLLRRMQKCRRAHAVLQQFTSQADASDPRLLKSLRKMVEKEVMGDDSSDSDADARGAESPKKRKRKRKRKDAPPGGKAPKKKRTAAPAATGQRVGSKAYTGCRKCGSKKHLASDCPRR